MKKLSRHLCLATLTLLLATFASAQQSPSIEQLRQQIQALIAVENDPATGPDVRKINHGFVEKRRRELLTPLKARLRALLDYQKTVNGVLTAEESRAVAGEIQNTTGEIESLDSALAADPSSDGTMANRPVELASLSTKLFELLHGFVIFAETEMRPAEHLYEVRSHNQLRRLRRKRTI